MKILRYLSDGNTLSYSTPKNFQIYKQTDYIVAYNHDPKFERVYIALIIEGIPVDFGLYNDDVLHKQDFERIQKKYIDLILHTQETESFYVKSQLKELLNLIDNSFYADNDTTKEERLRVLEIVHNNHLQEKQQQKQKEEQLQQERKQKYDTEMINLLESFRQGNSVTWMQLNELIEYHGIKIHPRTKGFLQEHANIRNSQNISKQTGVFIKGKSAKSIQSFFDFLKTI